MEYGLRDCEVLIDWSWIPAKFHKWVDVKGVSALVELEDGSVKLVKPSRINFVNTYESKTKQ